MVYVWGLATIIDSSSREDKYKIAVARAILQSRAVVRSENPGGLASNKVEKILKGSLDLIPSPSPAVKIQIIYKVCLRCKGKTLLGIVNKKFGDITQHSANLTIIWIFTEGEGDRIESRLSS